MSDYDDKAPTCTVNVLGTEYRVYMGVKEADDEILRDADGYTDKTSHKIVIADKLKDTDLDDYGAYVKKVLRHELVHAFLFESGLGGCAAWHEGDDEHPEQMVDWIAFQFPKILKAFQTVGAL
jgi:hypothetical protein